MGICKNCQYFRQDHLIASDIPGSGTWCSNSKSKRYRTRVKMSDGCPQFYQRGKQAPGWMRRMTRKK